MHREKNAPGQKRKLLTVRATEPQRPCPSCIYNASTKALAGTMNEAYEDHPYPFTNMTLVLLNSNNQPIDTIANLPPTPQNGGTNVGQTVSTSASGVVRAVMRWTANDTTQVTQSITVE